MSTKHLLSMREKEKKKKTKKHSLFTFGLSTINTQSAQKNKWKKNIKLHKIEEYKYPIRLMCCLRNAILYAKHTHTLTTLSKSYESMIITKNININIKLCIPEINLRCKQTKTIN